MSRAAQTLRRYLIAVFAFSLMLASGAYAIANSDTSRLKGAIYACVTKDYSTLNLTSAKAKCPAGQRKIAWNVRGPKGKKGARGAKGPRGAAGVAGAKGAAGANGLPGPEGAAGVAGEPGPAGTDGATGATGPAGPQGTTGLTGATGDTGQDGAAGEQGPTGPTGATGATGDPGSGTILTSNGALSLTSLGGLSGQKNLLPLSGSLADPAPYWGPSWQIELDDPAAKNVVQTLPRNGLITSISGWFSNSVAIDMGSSTGLIHAQLYISHDGIGPLTLVPEASCIAGSLTGVVPVNEKFTMNCTGLAVPISAGSIGLVETSISVVGLTPAIAVSLNGSVGIGIS